MVSLETLQMPDARPVDPSSSPRISFSADFLDESDFISISPGGTLDEEEEEEEEETDPDREKPRILDHNFEFLSDLAGGHATMLTAEELFSEGKLLPFWAMQQAEKLTRINLKPSEEGGEGVQVDGGEGGEGGREDVGRTDKEPPAMAPPRAINWSFLDDDPSPRPPNCTVLWKELLRLKKHRRPNHSSSLSPSSSSSSTSSSSSSMADAAAMDEKKKEKEKKKKKKKKTTMKDGDAGLAEKNDNSNDNDTTSHMKRIQKGLERTRSGSIRIRPMVNVPICTPVSWAGSGGGRTALPPLFPLKKGRA